MAAFPPSFFSRTFKGASEFSPRKKLVLGRTGWKGSIASLSDEMSRELDLAWDACLAVSRPFAACVGFSFDALGDVPLPGTWKDIEAFSLFVCTVGPEVSDLVMEAFSDERPFSGAVIDACAGEIVDGVADRIDLELENESAVNGLRGLTRISPGYEPIGLLWNPVLLARIAELFIEKEGLKSFPVTANAETGILMPRKSVLCLKGWVRN